MEREIPVIIPAYEPDERMIFLIKDLRKQYKGSIVVVNDGSSNDYDHLYEEASGYGCDIMKHYCNLGKGRALKDAFNYCLNKFPDMIGCVTADSDGQHHPDDIFRCMDALRNNPDKLILGCRNFEGDNIPAKSRLGNKLTMKVCKLLCGLEISDTQTGLRGIPKSFMADMLGVQGERFEYETRMLIESKNRYPVYEMRIETIYDSKENHQTHFKPIRDSVRIYKIFGGVFLSFLFSSLSSSVIDVLLFYLFTKILKQSVVYYLLVATIFARILSASYNYAVNYKLVFQSNEKHTKSMSRYIMLAIVQMCCSGFFVMFGCRMFWALPEVTVKIVVDTILFFLSFMIQREVVFKRKSHYELH